MTAKTLNATTAMRVILIFGVVTCCGLPIIAAYGDYDDSGDDFWRDTPVKNKPKEKLDEKTGQRLVATTIRFFQARLKPDRHRTQASSAKLAHRLNEIFFEEGISHNKASPGGAHVIVIQTRDEWEEVAEAVFSLPDVYDVTTRGEVKMRPGETAPYIDLWRAEMGDDVPEPLAAQQPQPRAVGKPKGTKTSVKKKRTSRKEKGKEGNVASGAEL